MEGGRTEGLREEGRTEGSLATPFRGPTARLALSPCRSSEDSLDRMCSQQFSERLKVARLDAAPVGLTSLKISRSSSSPPHTLRAVRVPEALLLLCMMLQRGKKKKSDFLLKTNPDPYRRR